MGFCKTIGVVLICATVGSEDVGVVPSVDEEDGIAGALG